MNEVDKDSGAYYAAMMVVVGLALVLVAVLAPVWLIVDVALHAAGRQGFVQDRPGDGIALIFTSDSFRKKVR